MDRLSPNAKMLATNGLMIVIALLINFLLIRYWTKGEIVNALVAVGDGEEYNSTTAADLGIPAQIAALQAAVASNDIVRYSHNFRITQPGSEGAGAFAVTGQDVIRWQGGSGQRFNLTR